MKSRNFRDEQVYAVTVAFLQSWLNAGLITREEYNEAERKLREKYAPKTSEILMNIDLQ